MKASEPPGRSEVPPNSDADLIDLRLRYETAYDAYQTCVFALENAWRRGDRPTAQLMAQHAETLRHLNEERARYRDALVQLFRSDDRSH